MRLKVELLDQDSTLNNLVKVSQARIHRGETAEIVVQLLQENGQRYIPADGAVIKIAIPRNKEVIPMGQREREVIDHTIDREATQKFPKDGSIYSIPLTSTETKALISGAIKVTVTEGAKIKICQENQAIKIVDGQER